MNRRAPPVRAWLAVAVAVAAAAGCAAPPPVGAARVVYYSAGGRGKVSGSQLGESTMAFVNRGYAALVNDTGELRRGHEALKVVSDELMADLLGTLADEGFGGYAEPLDPEAALGHGAHAFVAAERDGRWRTFVQPPRPLATDDARAREVAFAAMAHRLLEVFQERTQFFVPGGRNGLPRAWSAP